MGKSPEDVAIDRKIREAIARLPAAIPVKDEKTQVNGVLGPSPGSHAHRPQQSRSDTPNPRPYDLAEDAESARSERQRVRERVAATDRNDKSTLDSLTEIPGIRKGLSVFWRWVAPLLLGAVTTVGGWLYGYAKGLAAAYERVAAIEQRAKTMSERMAAIEASVEGISNVQAAEARSNRAERATAKARYEELVEELNKSVPKIQGLAPKP